METIGRRLARLRKAKGLSQARLAELAGFSGQGAIGNIERGIRDYGATIIDIARVLDTTPEYLRMEDGAPAKTSNIAPARIGARRIPLISYVQAGLWNEVSDPYPVGEADDWLLTDLDLSENAFALEIEGNSMLPEFKPGDRVIIDPTISPRPGDFVVAKNGNEEATFKKYRPRGVDEAGEMVFELVPLNDDYPTMRSDITPIRIVGVMVEHRKYRRA